MGFAFDRLTLAERGHLPNQFTLLPVRRLDFHESELEIVTRRGSERVPYSSLRAEIRVTHRWKSYGKAAGAYIKQTLVLLSSPRRTYRIDLSGQFPDFKPQREILELVRSRIATTESKESLAAVKKRHNRDFVVFMAVGLAILWLLLKFR